MRAVMPVTPADPEPHIRSLIESGCAHLALVFVKVELVEVVLDSAKWCSSSSSFREAGVVLED